MRTNNKIRPEFTRFIKSGFVLASIVLLFFATIPNFAQDAGNATQSDESTNISKDELREMLAEMLLGEKSETDKFSDEVDDDDLELYEVLEKDDSVIFGEKLARIIRKLPDFPQDFANTLGKSTDPKMGWSGFRVAMAIILVVIIGLVVEQFTTRKLLNRLYLYVDGKDKTTLLKYKYIVIRIIIQFIGVATLAIATYFAKLYFVHENSYFELLLSETIGALIMMRVWMILLKNIFSPKHSALRPVPLDDVSSNQLYLWFVVFFGIVEFAGGLFEYLSRSGFDVAHLNGSLIPYTLSLNLIILSRVWVMRKSITAMFLVEPLDKTGQYNFSSEFFQALWPFAFTAWLLTLWALWLYKAILGLWDDANLVSISWWITLAFLVADRIFYGAIKNVSNLDWLHSPTFETRSRRFIKIVLNGFRLLMITFAVYTFTQALGLNEGNLMKSSLSNKILGQGIDLLIITAIAYIIWEFFNALIERSLPQEVDAIATLEGEGGGAGATRAETLLPLIRTCLTVVLFTFLLLSILHSFGIAITPLLAGAGVVGIAIGFGAQKLVQDVLSGIFFLVDDAFRKNEYIEIENLRGTVEKISLRSMQLRHHLGAVQTVPYGEIKTVKNLSRDWITMKLELRLSYDTDIEQVRKIIKKVGQSMLEDEELGPSFILPLKSQGVMRMEESALIVRMKFTTKPGEQWVIRREAYRRVRDALAAAGIFFAHREVRVRLPDDQITKGLDENDPATKEMLSKAGAAATDSIIATDAEKKGKIDYDNEM